MTVTTSPFKHQPQSEHNVHGGVQYRFKFPNGYGASVIRHSFSYGGDVGLWELAVLSKHGGLDYTTPITDDVLGRLTDAEVDTTLDKIAELEPEND